MNNGIQLACTGVVLLKPMLETAERIHSDSPGVSASQLLEDLFDDIFEDPRTTTGAIVVVSLYSEEGYPGLPSQSIKKFQGLDYHKSAISLGLGG